MTRSRKHVVKKKAHNVQKKRDISDETEYSHRSPLGGDHSLQSEAANTQRRQHTWTSDTKLRYAKVSFVSGGYSTPIKPSNEALSLSKMSLNEEASLETSTQSEDEVQGSVEKEDEDEAPPEDTTGLFVVDTRGGSPVPTDFPPPRIRSASRSPAPSDSSEDVVVFRGRARGQTRVDPVAAHSRHVDSPNTRRQAAAANVTVSTVEVVNVTRVRGTENKRSHRNQKRSQSRNKMELEQRVLDDYLQNISADASSPNMVFRSRELGVADTDAWPEIDALSVDSSHDSDEAESDSDSISEDESLPKQDGDHMTDEQLAFLLSKQEELGIDTIDFGLGGDMLGGDLSDDEDLFFLESVSRAQSKRSRRAKGKTFRGEPPSASVVADAYDDFDVMDFERPSLQRRQNGRKSQPQFDLSDSDLETAMQLTWGRDRLKKKDKKLERQQLRAAGLLGNPDKPDLKARYKEGMGMESIKHEIKEFLKSANTTLALPPMEKASRKTVHEIANVFNLKSKSAGSGNKRFPILYRTSRSHAFTESRFASVEARVSRRFLSRTDYRGKGASKGSSRGGAAGAGVTYRDGDVVGASAPELGAENKGRAMLEKMGWSTGTALGALNNKGILEPVSHVVKTTKAGLG